jgi:hypothetical protein
LMPSYSLRRLIVRACMVAQQQSKAKGKWQKGVKSGHGSLVTGHASSETAAVV